MEAKERNLQKHKLIENFTISVLFHLSPSFFPCFNEMNARTKQSESDVHKSNIFNIIINNTKWRTATNVKHRNATFAQCFHAFYRILMNKYFPFYHFFGDPPSISCGAIISAQKSSWPFSYCCSIRIIISQIHRSDFGMVFTVIHRDFVIYVKISHRVSRAHCVPSISDAEFVIHFLYFVWCCGHFSFFSSISISLELLFPTVIIKVRVVVCDDVWSKIWRSVCDNMFRR